MLAKALYDEMGLKVTNGSPMLNAFDPLAIPFGLDNMTLHHMNEPLVRQIFAKEERSNNEELLLRDVFETVYTTDLPWRQENWKHLASDPKWMLDFDSCKAACEGTDHCLQFVFLNTTLSGASGMSFKQRHACFLSMVFRLGHAKVERPFSNEHEPGVFRSWTSGWRRDRIANWVQNRKECAGGDQWVEI